LQCVCFNIWKIQGEIVWHSEFGNVEIWQCARVHSVIAMLAVCASALEFIVSGGWLRSSDFRC